MYEINFYYVILLLSNLKIEYELSKSLIRQPFFMFSGVFGSSQLRIAE